MIEYSKRTRFALPIVFVAIALALAFVPGHTSAHATLERSDPAANSILAESPTELRLWFTEPLEQSESNIRLFDQSGAQVSDIISEPGDGPKSMVAPLPKPLDKGTYSVAWKALSAADGHSLQGYFTFTVGSDANVASVIAPVLQDDTGAPLWLQTVARWLVLLFSAIAVAVWPVWLLVFWPSLRSDTELAQTLGKRAGTIGTIAIGGALLANLLMLGVQASFVDNGSLISRMIDTATDTRFGRLWFARMGLLLLLAVSLSIVPWLHPIRKRFHTAIGLLVSVLTLIPLSLNSHAAAMDAGRTTALVFDFVHVLCASLWFGGLFVLAGVLLRSPRIARERRALLARAVPRFSALALVCWGLLAVTGGYAAWLHVGSLEAFRSTPYGQSLHNKLRIIGFVFILATANLFLISRKLGKSDEKSGSRWAGWLTYAVISELILAVFIFGMVGRMTSQQPGRDVLAAQQAGQTIHFDLDGRDTTLLLTPGTAGVNHFTLTIPGDPVPDGTEVLLRVDLIDNSIGTKEISFDRTSPTIFESHGSDLGIAGGWDLDLLVRKIGAFEWTDTQPVALEMATTSAPESPWRLDIGGAVGLILIAIGSIGAVMAWRAGKGRMRLEFAGLGILALLLGGMLISQGRVESIIGYDPTMTNPIPPTSDVIARGAESYQTNCASCHGAAGRGDGSLADGMLPKPADFTAAHAKLHPDAELYYWIVNGKPLTEMPAFRDTLTDEQIWQLIDYIQVTFQDKPLVGATPVAGE